MTIRAKAKRTLRGLQKFTERQNAKFNAATRAEKRCIIAQDVINALKERRIRAGFGYLSLHGKPAARADNDDDLRDLLARSPACEGCAKGSLLMCTVMRRDDVTVREASSDAVADGRELSSMLGGIFSPNQLDAIETAFEMGSSALLNIMGGAAATAFRKQRMIRIMEHVIRRGGRLDIDAFVREEMADPKLSRFASYL